ncbi:TetR/AcrR family transcriptional regulator [Demequina globuliformis]|uniref:TetR/AcrR family transcriptional regulator n=1 Tax=Demequina globuliformis TaxID=676202 RepID=UPI0007827808|nr:TetR/AcrR family transcriptional regulator [Demequina globuliformis]
MAAVRGHAREDIVTTASALFTAHGIRAVSADRIIADAGVSKVTFYRHFAAKDDLVVAYLRRELARLQDYAAAHEPDVAVMAALFKDQMCHQGFRGCPFMNAAAEYPDPAHPVRAVVVEFRAWMVGQFAAWATATGAADPARVARTIMMLRDGALVDGYMSGEPDRVVEELTAGIEVLVSASASGS